MIDREYARQDPIPDNNPILSFLHIPKTAGTSIRQTLNRQDRWGHRPVSVIPRENWAGLWTVVRNPYDRAISIYAHVHNIRGKCNAVVETENLIEWWASDHDPIVNQQHKMFFKTPMAKYVTYKGVLVVKDILRFENLNEEFRARFGVKLKDSNKTFHKDWREYYNNELYDIITARFQVDLDLFNYSFDLAETEQN